jgi:hypothetical protein
MINIFLITSIINIPNIPLSYTKIRSVYDKNSRFNQTKNTIETIKNKIPNIKIFLIECSELLEEETNYLKDNVDIFLNIYNSNDCELLNKVYSHSKSMGEGTMTINAFNYLIENKINYDNIFKISGRYWLSNFFNLENFYNNKIIVKNNTKPYQYYTCLYTSLYKLDKETADLWHIFLKNSQLEFQNCESFESIFANFIKTQPINKVVYLEKLGVSGNVAIDGCFIDD